MLLSHHLSTDESHNPQGIDEGQGMVGQWIYCHEAISTQVKTSNNDLPMVNIIYNFPCGTLTMHQDQVLIDPGDCVVFERPIDHLM